MGSSWTYKRVYKESLGANLAVIRFPANLASFMHYRPSCGDCAVFGEIPVDMPEKDKRKFDLIVERQVDRLTSAR